MTPGESALMAAMVSCLLPALAVTLRSRKSWFSFGTWLAAITISLTLFFVFRLSRFPGETEAMPWVRVLTLIAVPLLLSGYLFSALIGRDDPAGSFRSVRRTFGLLAVVGIVAMAFFRHPGMVTGYESSATDARILLGPFGKAFLSFLLIGIVFIGYNLESTYRTSAAEARPRLRFPFLSLFGLLGFLMYVLTWAILYSVIEINKLAAVSIPFGVTNLFIAYGFLRGSLTDVTTPVSRKIVYSSFSALSAGFYVLAIGLVTQISAFTKWSPDEVVTLSLGFLAVLTAVLLIVSNRFQRRVRRFIDRNFYVNRYDYRSQWSRVTGTLDPAKGKKETLAAAADLLSDVFLADKVTIALKESATSTIRPVFGKGVGEEEAALPAQSPLCATLWQDRTPLLLNRKSDDFEYIPIYAENGRWLDLTASQIVAPILYPTEVAGVIGLERNHRDDPFTFEEVALLDSVAAHISSVLRTIELTTDLAESREVELLSQWSSMLLHDLKNYVAPLRMIGQNLINHRDRPDMPQIVARDLERITTKMESLAQTLAELRRDLKFSKQVVDLNELVRNTLDSMPLASSGIQLDLALNSPMGVAGDDSLLRRVVENLITNAVEAMDGKGTLRIATKETLRRGNSTLTLTVADTGAGMDESFISNQLFRPFATTKKQGLGLGLYQCRSIVRAHGGTLNATSKPGAGTEFHMILEAAPLRPSEEAIPTGV